MAVENMTMKILSRMTTGAFGSRLKLAFPMQVKGELRSAPIAPYFFYSGHFAHTNYGRSSYQYPTAWNFMLLLFQIKNASSEAKYHKAIADNSDFLELAGITKYKFSAKDDVGKVL